MVRAGLGDDQGDGVRKEHVMLTLSIIKADTGGFVGHSSVHPSMVEAARKRVEDVKGSLLIDGQVATCGDDLSLILTHTHGAEHEGVHRFAFDVFMALTDIAVELGLYGAGQDLLSDAFSGNLRGLGPGYAELTFRERVSEPVLCFLADKTEPGAWNLPLFRIFADPFATAGLVIDPKMHAGFRVEVHDLVEGKQPPQGGAAGPGCVNGWTVTARAPPCASSPSISSVGTWASPASSR
jgi:fructose 1,6-bisphosphate aldolase/phosphatase